MNHRNQIISPYTQVIAYSKPPINHASPLDRVPTRSLRPVGVLNVIPLMERALKFQPRICIRVITNNRCEKEPEIAASQRTILQVGGVYGRLLDRTRSIGHAVERRPHDAIGLLLGHICYRLDL